MKYVIVTPAYNEEEYIGETIDSVVAQTVKPLLWVIVDDGSTDNTSKIIRKKTEGIDWIEYLYREKKPGQTYYASNVYAINEGLKRIASVHYSYLAILDADITLPNNYYEEIQKKLESDKKLGVCSGITLMKQKDKYKPILFDRRSCPKNIMVFRKACFEDIGGFVPLKYGGEDTLACFMSRMKGWKSWSFPDIETKHNKPLGSGRAKSIIKIHFNDGFGEYFLAYPPLFVFLKSVRRCFLETPYMISGAARLCGYFYARFTKEKIQIPEDIQIFIKEELSSRAWNGNRIPDKYKYNGINT